MDGPAGNRSVEFFDAQFQQQISSRDYTLNPFETAALDHLVGSVLDLGCGLGNLSLEAGRRGHRVVAVDASPSAIARINADAQRERLAVRAQVADLASWNIDQPYDTIVAIGLLMFFRRERALELLHGIQDHVNPGGCAVVNVLVAGTTYLDMFHPENYSLFAPEELVERFVGWNVVSARRDSFPAPRETRKEFLTVVAMKPGGTGRSAKLP